MYRPNPNDLIGEPPPLARISSGRGNAARPPRPAKPSDKVASQHYYHSGTPAASSRAKATPSRHHPYSAPSHHPGQGHHVIPTYRPLSVTVASGSTSGYVSSTAFGPALSIYRLPSSAPSSNTQSSHSGFPPSATYGTSTQSFVPHTYSSSGTVYSYGHPQSASSGANFQSVRMQQQQQQPGSLQEVSHGTAAPRQSAHRNQQWTSSRYESISISHPNTTGKTKEERNARYSALPIQMPHVDTIPVQLTASQNHHQSTPGRHVLYPATMEPITHAQQQRGSGLTSSTTHRNWHWHHQTPENSKRVESGKLQPPATEATSTRRSPMPGACQPTVNTNTVTRLPNVKTEMGTSDVASVMGQLSTVLLQRCPCPEKLYALTAILLEAMDNGLTCNIRPQSPVAMTTSPAQHSTTTTASNDVPRETRDLPGEMESKFIAISMGILPEQARVWQSQVTNDPAVNSGNGQFWCRTCRIHFPWRRQLEFHYLSHRSEDRPSVCHICGKCFTRGEHTNRHAYMHNMKDFVCQLCGAVFPRVSHMEDHWSTDHLNIVYGIDNGECDHDGSSEGGNNDGVTDENVAQPPSPPSNLLSRYTDLVGQINPNKAGKWQSRIRKDPATHSATGDYWCSQCQKTFTWRHQLEFHFLSHRTDERPSVCHVCGKCFTRGDHTNRHAYMHNMKDFICQLCGEVFCRVSYLGEHWLKEHFAGVEDEPFPLNGSDLASDDNQSTDLSKPEIVEGDAASNRQSNGLVSQSLSSVINVNPDSFLGRLLDSVQAPEPASMDYAPSPVMRTRKRRDRRRSLLSNSPPTRDTSDDDPLFEPMSFSGTNSRRPYRCEVCARAFSRLAHLQRHQRVHMGSKPFRCSLCGRSFTRGDYLRAHVVVHHDRNVILCKTCGREFSTMGALTNHQKTHARDKNKKSTPRTAALKEEADEGVEESPASGSSSGDENTDAAIATGKKELSEGSMSGAEKEGEDNVKEESVVNEDEPTGEELAEEEERDEDDKEIDEQS